MAPCWPVAVLTTTSSMSMYVKGRWVHVILFSPQKLFLSLKTAVITLASRNPDYNKLAALTSGVVSSSSGPWDEMEIVLSKSAVKTAAVTVSSSPGGGASSSKAGESQDLWARS